jgi:hypothetical protein
MTNVQIISNLVMFNVIKMLVSDVIVPLLVYNHFVRVSFWIKLGQKNYIYIYKASFELMKACKW